jgi:alpha-1,3-rhamnosyl/mannosyltransferase
MNKNATLCLIVNLSPLRPPLTGIGHYTRELLLRLIDDPMIGDVQGFYYHKWLTKEQIRTLLHFHTAEKMVALQRKWTNFFWIRTLYGVFLRRVHRGKMASLSNYLYWETNYLPVPFSGKMVVTIYDLSFIRYPEFHPSARIKAFDKGLSKGLNVSTGVVTISQFSYDEILHFYPMVKNKIAIIPPGTSKEFHPRTQYECDVVRYKYKLPDQFWLSVATIEPRKNFKNLILSYVRLRSNYPHCHPLVLVGTQGWLSDDLEPLLKPLLEEGSVVSLGYVPQEDLPVLYAAADALLYLSMYEGYGMPVAEAICSGIPVLTSSVSSMPEVGGNRAWYADPTSIDSIVAAMETMSASLNPQEPHLSTSFPPPRIHSWDDAQRQLRQFFENFL